MKRKPAEYAQASHVGQFGQSNLVPSMHNTKQPGVTTLDVSPSGTLLLTGGKDKQVQVFDRSSEKVLATLKGHTKEITQVAFAVPTMELQFGSPSTVAPSFAVSASADASVRVWKAAEKAGAFVLAHTINDFKAAVTGVCVHPCADLFAAASKDGSWALFDLSTGSRLLRGVAAGSEEQEWTCLDIHPDGILMALGTTNGSIRILDIRTGQQSASFQTESGGQAVTSLSFSENGYLLASATASQVEVWDLRKLVKAGSIAVEGDGKIKVTVRFDPSAQFLAVVGADVRIYANKTWQLLWSDDASNTAEVSDVKWDWTNGSLVTASLDRTVRTFAPKAGD